VRGRRERGVVSLHRPSNGADRKTIQRPQRPVHQNVNARLTLYTRHISTVTLNFIEAQIICIDTESTYHELFRTFFGDLDGVHESVVHCRLQRGDVLLMGPNWVYFTLAIQESALFVCRFLTHKQLALSIEPYEFEMDSRIERSMCFADEFETTVVVLLLRAWECFKRDQGGNWVRRLTMQRAMKAVEFRMFNTIPDNVKQHVSGSVVSLNTSKVSHVSNFHRKY
jgi:hypothetical protein